MPKINKGYVSFKLNNQSELLGKCEKLISKAYVLNPILKEIKNLKRGEVNPKSTLKRSRVSSYFSSEIQQIFNYIYNHKIIIDEKIIIRLNKIISKADEALRENVVLQSKSPLDVIKFKNIPLRYSYSTFGGKEQRWGYGLHKSPTTDFGHSICIAIMPPRYTQSYHNHNISEYTLVLDKKLVAITDSGKNKNIAYKNEMLHFSATTPHTLFNPADSLSRNITVKQPVGIKDWRPVYNLNPIKYPHSEVLKGRLLRSDTKGETKISFSIKDKYYDYKLEISQLKKDLVIENIHDKDKYILVVDGKLIISSKDIKKHCSKNDFIVIDKNTNFKIETKTQTRLYSVILK